MDAAEGQKLGLPKMLPTKWKKRSIYFHHNRSGSQEGTNAEVHNTGDTTPVAAEDTNDIKLEIA